MLAAAAAVLLAQSVPGGAPRAPRGPALPPVPAGVRNVVLCIADGAGFAHFAAAERRAGHGRPWDRFPVRLAVGTAPAGAGPTDSAAAATALATGVKTRRGALGVSPAGAYLPNLLERAEAAGRATGIVTSVAPDDATPAAFLGHAPHRSEGARVLADALRHGAVDAIFGAGHPEFDEAGRPLRRPGPYGPAGGRRTFEDLRAGRLAAADADGDGVPDPWTFVETSSRILALGEGPAPKRVFALAPAAKSLPAGPATGVPRLAEMVRAALNVIDGDPEGFVLVVEGGAVDGASHRGQTERMLAEMAEFAAAVEAVLAWRDASPERAAATLVVVTADHETGGLSEADLTWSTDRHTDAPVPLFAAGPGAEEIRARATGRDPRRGPLLDNAALGAFLNRLVAPRFPPLH